MVNTKPKPVKKLPNNFYLEPNYTNGEKESFNLSISYKI